MSLYAFTNANIISKPGVKFENSTLLIQGNKILDLDSNLSIPKGAIIYDLNGDYIFPHLLIFIQTMGYKKQKRNTIIDHNTRVINQGHTIGIKTHQK